MPLASIPSPAEGVWYLGFIPIRAYALCIVLGVIVAVWLSERRWRARGGQAGTIIDIAVPAVIFGLIGGRLYHVITDWQTYFGDRAIKEPYRALFIWEGGLGIWGAVALGGFGVWLAARKRGLSMGALADTIAPGLAFAQAIGRWGNWFNQELYGSPTTLPWGLEIDVDHGGEPGVLYHPTFLYESLWDLALGFVLILAGRRFALHHGRLFALYVAGYTAGRFWIEGLRIDPVGGVDYAVEFIGLRINQWTSIVLFVAALAYFWATRNKTGEEVVVSPFGTDPKPSDPAHAEGQDDSDVDPLHASGQDDPGPDPLHAKGQDDPGVDPPHSDGQDDSDVDPLHTKGQDDPGADPLHAKGQDDPGVDPLHSTGQADLDKEDPEDSGDDAAPKTGDDRAELPDTETATKEKNSR
ncbi:prolipoprotein diacylglyceryl transferase [Nonomuraea sp. NPDC050404]|uniref:prolipoprotein diacylglyceryl transferase n=1 Tax=Nonomuraea sp. NPDC050404 TaxID=3155783 RepID=UPI0034000D8C